MDDETFLKRFEAAAIPREDWRHRDHIRAAYLYLRRHPLDEATDRIRANIQKLNAAHQTPETLERGYHETITQAWMRLEIRCAADHVVSNAARLAHVMQIRAAARHVLRRSRGNACKTERKCRS